MKKQMTFMLVGLGIILGGVFGFQAFKLQMIKKFLASNQSPVVTVSAITAAQETWEPTIKGVGSLRAVLGVDVTTEMAGLVQRIHFTAGDEVQAKDPLVDLTIDPELASLEALEASAELAALTYQRDMEQIRAKTVSQSVLDTDLAQLKSSQAQVASQKAVIAKKKITAPFAGRLGISTINPGQYLQAGDKIVSLQALDPIYIDFYVPQKKLYLLSLNQKVQIVTDSYPEEIFYGVVTGIEPKIDSATRNIQIQATIENPEKKLMPGMFAKAEMQSGTPAQYITVPLTAITYNSYGESVYLVEKDSDDRLKVKQSFVKTGSTRGDQVAVLEGIKEGDSVVTSGQLKLRNGAFIKIDNTVTPSNDSRPVSIDE